MKIKNQKIIAVGLSIGLIASAICPAVAETIGKTEQKRIAAEYVTPLDLEKIDLNSGLSMRMDFNDKNGETVTINKPLADCDTQDYIEMGKAGMSHDEVIEVLGTAYEKGTKIKDVINQVKNSSKDRRVSKEGLKEKLGNLPNKKDSIKVEREENLKKAESLNKKTGQKIKGPDGEEYDVPLIPDDYINKNR